MSNHDWVGDVVESVVEALPMSWWSVLLIVLMVGGLFYFW